MEFEGRSNRLRCRVVSAGTGPGVMPSRCSTGINIFTDSQAAMLRPRDDRPGPGQSMAARGIRIAKEAIRGGATITIRSVPGHAGVQGNEVADQWALEAATREHKRRLGRESLESPVVTSGHTSQAFMRTVLKVRAVTRWRDEITRRCRGRRPFRIPKEGEIPRIPTGLRRAPKEVTSRFFQLASGHAMIAPFLSEKFGWIDSGSCWWCSGGRQSRENLFKECRTWKGISTLWREVGEISGGCEKKDLGSMYKGRKGFCFGMEKRQARPGNCSVGKPMGDSRFTEAVLKFLASTWVGKIKEGVVLKRD